MEFGDSDLKDIYGNIIAFNSMPVYGNRDINEVGLTEEQFKKSWQWKKDKAAGHEGEAGYKPWAEYELALRADEEALEQWIRHQAALRASGASIIHIKDNIINGHFNRLKFNTDHRPKV